ncbi:MAG: LysR family transcriptional regulator [Alphaproteobacteria bacterium]|nr:LysR family transcriptional regulator [Alphaproteobacteria bacterium]
MNWDDLRYALSVSELGSLSAAAESLGVNASTVLRRIAALEKSLDIRLFERDRTGYRLTQEGQALIQSLRPVQERIAAIGKRYSPAEQGAEMVMSMAAPAALAGAVIAPRINQFRLENPGMVLNLEATSGLAPVKLGMLDLALFYGSPSSGEMLVRRLADVGYGLYATPELLSRNKRSSEKILSGLPMIGMGNASSALAPGEWSKNTEADCKVVMRTEDAYTRYVSVISNVGIAVLPCFLADGVPGITRIQGPDTVGRAELWLATHREARHVARLRAIVDFLVKLTRDRRQRLAGEGV